MGLAVKNEKAAESEKSKEKGDFCCLTNNFHL